MTWVFEERDLRITIDGAVDARKFDEPSTHRVGFMKAVDFVVEFADRYVFIEFKDPQQTGSELTSEESLLDYYQSEKIDNELIYKYRDSLLYEWAAGRADRDVYYLVLIAIDNLTLADLDKKKRDLDRKLPSGVPRTWDRSIVSGCGVFNLDSWNARFPDFQVSRLSLHSSAQS